MSRHLKSLTQEMMHFEPDYFAPYRMPLSEEVWLEVIAILVDLPDGSPRLDTTLRRHLWEESA